MEIALLPSPVGAGGELRVRADRPQEAQVDGDTIGKARAITAEVVPGALLVRVGSAD